MNKGKCICGKVSYEVTEKVEKLYQCHCTMCQQQTGSSSQTGFFVGTESFKWISGEFSITNFCKESGYSYSFCSKCGSTVPNMFRSGNKFWVPAGALVNLKNAKVEDHIFVADKADWDDIGGEGVQHEGFYPVFADPLDLHI
ncbi:MAG: GFA family protein [Pseudomonadales bacterium]|nr:GFA family protein [Pseudomonadales bacterium]